MTWTWYDLLPPWFPASATRFRAWCIIWPFRPFSTFPFSRFLVFSDPTIMLRTFHMHAGTSLYVCSRASASTVTRQMTFSVSWLDTLKTLLLKVIISILILIEYKFIIRVRHATSDLPSSHVVEHWPHFDHRDHFGVFSFLLDLMHLCFAVLYTYFSWQTHVYSSSTNLHLPCDPQDFPFLHFDLVFLSIFGLETELNAESDAGWLPCWFDWTPDGDLATGDRIGDLDDPFGFKGITIVCTGWTWTGLASGCSINCAFFEVVVVAVVVVVVVVVVEVLRVVGFVVVVVFFVDFTASAVKPMNKSSISSGSSVFTDDEGGIVTISGASVVFFFGP